MKVVVVGTGYVGLVTGTCLAELGHYVTCIDIDLEKIAILNRGELPIYEPGLSDLVDRNVEGKRLFFTNTYDSVADAKVIFLAVGTPSAEDGTANLAYITEAAKNVASRLKDGAVVVIKSTVPVGTSSVLAEMMRVETRAKFVVVNNPEFLKEGSAVVDFMRPDRVVVGHCGGEEESIMNELYAPLVMQGNPIFHMSNLSAELTKYAANCFLAMKISFINEMARLCDACGADIEEVRKGITSDARIGGAFLYPGPGYGGSCFPKDVRAMMNIAKNYQTEMKIVTATDEVNIEQKSYIFKKILNHFKGDLKGKVFAMWGVSFKPNTDDIRESASIEIAENIVRHGGSVRFYDPVAAKNFAELMSELKLSGVEGVTNKYDALNKSDACIVLTDWSEFKAPDFAEMKLRLKSPILFDFRNLYKSRTLIDQGFTYYSIGKRSVP